MVTAIDLVIIIIIAWFLISGVRKGLIRQVLEVVGIIAAFICSFYLAHRLALYLQPRVDIPANAATVVSAVIIFAGVIIGFHFLGLAIRKFISITLLGTFDRIMGGVFGAVKGLLLCSLLLIILLALPVPGNFRSQMEEDPLVSFVKPLLPVLFNTVFSASDTSFDDIVNAQERWMDRAAGRTAEFRKQGGRIAGSVAGKAGKD